MKLSVRVRGRAAGSSPVSYPPVRSEWSAHTTCSPPPHPAAFRTRKGSFSSRQPSDRGGRTFPVPRLAAEPQTTLGSYSQSLQRYVGPQHRIVPGRNASSQARRGRSQGESRGWPASAPVSAPRALRLEAVTPEHRGQCWPGHLSGAPLGGFQQWVPNLRI